MERKTLARAAALAALRTRARAGLGLTDPANPVDIAEKLGVQVWFRRLPSLEGMLIRAPHAVILLSSLRPSGRIAFTCAHELGHHWFDHPGHVDAFEDEPRLHEDTADEYQANMFAAHLLMPKTTVQFGFAQRGLTPEAAEPIGVLAVAHWLGVGYTALLHHLSFNLGLLSERRAEVLLRHTPKDIAGAPLAFLTGGSTAYLVDRSWRSRPVDLEVGDVALVEGDVTSSGSCLALRSDLAGKTVASAIRPGTGHLDGGTGWATYVRVRRSRYEGRAIFRHLEDTDDE
jgi:hypothetical protein